MALLIFSYRKGGQYEDYRFVAEAEDVFLEYNSITDSVTESEDYGDLS